MAKTLLNVNGRLLFEDPGDPMHTETGSGPTPPSECTICDNGCQDVYYWDVNMSSGTCANACTTLNVTDQALTRVGTSCQWTWVNGDYTYEMACDPNDSKWHAKIWYQGIGNTLCADWVQVSETVSTCPPIGSDSDGVWVRASGECFGNFGVKACSGSTNPSMRLTVTGASGTINWGGQTWNLPGDSGVTKTSCPTFYLKRVTTTSYTYAASHVWIASGLNFERQYSGYVDTAIPSCIDLNDWLNQIIVKTDYGNRWYREQTPTTTAQCGTFALYIPRPAGVKSVTTAGNAALLAKAAVGAPRPPAYGNDYHIPASMLSGSHTIGGITYTWAQGGGW